MLSFCDIFNKNRTNDEHFYCETSGLDEQQGMYTLIVPTVTSNIDTFLLNEMKIMTSQEISLLLVDLNIHSILVIWYTYVRNKKL